LPQGEVRISYYVEGPIGSRIFSAKVYKLSAERQIWGCWPRVVTAKEAKYDYIAGQVTVKVKWEKNGEWEEIQPSGQKAFNEAKYESDVDINVKQSMAFKNRTSGVGNFVGGVGQGIGAAMGLPGEAVDMAVIAVERFASPQDQN